LEGEMSSVFESKENVVKELRSQLKILEQRFESLKQTNILEEENLKIKEKQIKDHELVISCLEQSLNDEKISKSKQIDTLLKEIGEKSQTIKDLSSQLKEINNLKQNYEKHEIPDLKNQIVQTKKLLKENECIRIDEQNKCIEEFKLKFEEIFNLKKEIQLLQCTIKEKEKSCLDLHNCIDEINVKNNSLIKSEEELKMQIIDYIKSNEQLQNTIQKIQEEKEMVIKTLETKIEENQLEFDNLSKIHKEIVSQLNKDKMNKISEERSIESVIKDYNLLTEENAYLKKERQKILQMFQDMFKTFKNDFENLKLYAKEQLTEWALIFLKHKKQLKADFSTQIKLYHHNLINTKEKLESIKKAYFLLKSNCIQNLEYFKIEVIEKYNTDVMVQISQNNVELERKKIDLLRLHEEIDCKSNC